MVSQSRKFGHVRCSFIWFREELLRVNNFHLLHTRQGGSDEAGTGKRRPIRYHLHRDIEAGSSLDRGRVTTTILSVGTGFVGFPYHAATLAVSFPRELTCDESNTLSHRATCTAYSPSRRGRWLRSAPSLHFHRSEGEACSPRQRLSYGE